MPLHYKAVAWFGSIAPIPKLTLHVNGLMIIVNCGISEELCLSCEETQNIIFDPGFGCFGFQSGSSSASCPQNTVESSTAQHLEVMLCTSVDRNCKLFASHVLSTWHELRHVASDDLPMPQNCIRSHIAAHRHQVLTPILTIFKTNTGEGERH